MLVSFPEQQLEVTNPKESRAIQKENRGVLFYYSRVQLSEYEILMVSNETLLGAPFLLTKFFLCASLLPSQFLNRNFYHKTD